MCVRGENHASSWFKMVKGHSIQFAIEVWKEVFFIISGQPKQQNLQVMVSDLCKLRMAYLSGMVGTFRCPGIWSIALYQKLSIAIVRKPKQTVSASINK